MKKKPLIIGDLEFEYPFVLAPLAGITDRTMRSLCWQAGASLTYTEMVSAKGLWYGDRKTAELLTIGPEEGPVGYQLFGHEPVVLAHAVRQLEEQAQAAHAKAGAVANTAGELVSGPKTPAPVAAGNGTAPNAGVAANTAGELVPGPKTPAPVAAGNGTAPNAGAIANTDSEAAPELAAQVPGPPPKPWTGYDNDRRPVLYDLNAGCPVPKIVRNGEGSALLQDPDLLYDCVAAMCKASAKPVTVKIRKGFRRDSNTAVEIAKAAEAAGAAAITVHGRTREQYYEGEADWDVIGAVKAAVKIPVIGNGDVRSGADALRMMEETGCDGVMIARGALGNPWIFREARVLWDQLGPACKTGDVPAEALPDILSAGRPAAVTATLPGRQSAAAADDSADGSFIVPSHGYTPSAEERIGQLLRHIDLVCEDKGERMGVREMRKHIAWYTKGIRGAAQIRREANAADDAGELKRLLRSMIR